MRGDTVVVSRRLARSVRRVRERLEASFVALLAASALGVYALVIVGATVSATDGATACSSWPTCDGRWIVPLDDGALVAAMAHRALSLVVGAVVLVTAMTAWTLRAGRSIRGVLTLVLAIYPLQVALGAVTATAGGASPYPMLHLVTAMTIFVGALLALVWQLEVETDDVESTFETYDRYGDGTDETAIDTGGVETVTGDASASGSPASAADSGTSVPVAVEPASESTAIGRYWRRAMAYASLTKPRLMWLLCFVAVAGMGLATAGTGLPLTPTLVVGTLLGGVLAIGASGTFNHVLERDVDKKMGRTADRPTATDDVTIPKATAFGIALAAASLAVFLAMVNVLAAILGLVAIFFYSVVYTIVLKPNTTQNIVIGGAVGALPALIGWAAVTGSIGVPALLLGVLIFLWTPAHFYNLALAYKKDYERGGFPMLPITRGEAVTLRHISWYFGATLIAAVALGVAAPLGTVYAATVVAFAAIFLFAIIELYRARTPKAAFRTFHASNAFLGVVMVVIVVETLVF